MKIILSSVILVTPALFIWCSFFRAIIPSGSMENTLLVGDQLLVHKVSADKVTRGDIVIFEKDNELYVKRIIGLPNEIIYIDNGSVYVNGCLLQENYVTNYDNLTAQFVIPDNAYFMLGDNRLNSNDSRYWTNAFIDSSQIVGKVVWKLYPNFESIEEVNYEVY